MPDPTPSIRIAAPLYPGGRHCLLCGSATVGALFPPPLPEGSWRWHLFQLGAQASIEGHSRSESTARSALIGAFRLWLDQAALGPVATATGGGE